MDPETIDGHGQPQTDQEQAARTAEFFGNAMVVVQEDESIKWLAWEQATNAWLDAKRRRSGRRNTTRAYQCAVSQFFSFAAVAFDYHVPPWDVTPLMAEEWTRDLYDAGRAPSTVNLKLAALSSLYDYVQRRYVATGPDGRIISLWPADRANPFDAVERARVDPYGRARFPTVDELKSILASINTNCLTGKRDFALLYAFSVTCRRASELLELRWGDIQHDPLDDGNRIYTYQVRKKGKDQVRRAILDRNCYQAICAYLQADGRLDPAADHYPAADDYIFTAIDPTRIRRLRPDAEVNENRPLSNRFANEILKKYARRAGVDQSKAHLHGLRHAGARLRVHQQKELRGGVDYIEIMRLLEHSSLAVTQIYSQQILEDPEDPGGRAAADALLPKRRRRQKEAPAPEQAQLL